MRYVIWSLLLSGLMGGTALADTATTSGTATVASGTATAAPAAGAAAAAPAAPAFGITTTAFLDQGAIPVLYTCDGKNVSPEFAWTSPPAGTKAFAMIAADPTAPNGTWYHWIVYNLPADDKELTEGITQLPTGAAFGKNSWGKTDYEGPCPLKGTVHSYVFTLYALSQPVTLSGNVDGPSLVKAIKSITLGTQTQTAIYSRWPV